MQDLKEKKETLMKELMDLGYLRSRAVIEAFRQVPREEFVLPRYREHAYVNEPLPIQEGQTISQPLTVAAMTEALAAEKGQKILEVGAGSGYQAAILSVIAGSEGKVITTEHLETLYEFAKANLRNYKNVFVVHHDGSQGYEQEAPYDRIIVTASAPEIPQPLLEQLKTDSRLVIPVGNEMFLVEKSEKGGFRKTSMGYYAFVPLRGRYGAKTPSKL